MWKNMRNRTIGINVRVSENEKKKLQKNAQKANLKLSSYLRNWDAMIWSVSRSL